MSSFGATAGGLGVRQVPTAAPDAGDAAGGCLQVCMERLFDLVFAHTLPGVNETVKASFKTPLETLQYLQSLVGVVLDRNAPTPATEHFWSHLHKLVFGSGEAKDEPRLLEHLFDCLESVVPSAASTATGSEGGTVQVGDNVSAEALVLHVSGLGSATAGQAGAASDRVAVIMALEWQFMLLSLIAGVLRAAWRLSTWQEGGRRRKWHHELGFVPYVLWRLMASKDDKGLPHANFHARLALSGRILDVSLFYSSQETGGGVDMRALFKVLRNKILSALKLALISGLDMSWEAGETVRSCTLHDGEGAPQNHWVPKDSPFPSRVVAALMLARMLTLETSARPGNVLIAQTNEALGQLALACWNEGKFDANGGLGGRSELVKDRGGMKALEAPRDLAQFVCLAFESLEELSCSSCLLGSSASSPTLGVGSCRESEWTEQLNLFSRQVLLESVGVLCLAVKHLAEHDATSGVYKMAGMVLLGTADHAVYAITKAWPSLTNVAMQHLQGSRFDPHNKPNPRLAGLEFLLRECEKMRPKGLLLAEQDNGIQLVAMLNLALAMDADHAAAFDEPVSFAPLLLEAARSLVYVMQAGAGSWPSARVAKELVGRIVFCMAQDRHLSIPAVEEELERQLGQMSAVDQPHRRPLQCLLREVAIDAADQADGEMHAETRRGERGESGWRQVLELSLEAIGWYVFHSELNDCHVQVDGGHANAMLLLEELLSWKCERPNARAANTPGGLNGSSWRAAPTGRWNGRAGRHEGFLALLSGIIEHEQTQVACVDGTPVSNALVAMTEKIFRAFSFHALQSTGDSDDKTSLLMTLARLEEVWLQPDKQVCHVWTRKSSLDLLAGVTGSQGSSQDARSSSGWGWYSPYPTARFQGAMALHYLEPLVKVCLNSILAKATVGLACISRLPDMLRRQWSSHHDFVRGMLCYEHAKQTLPSALGVLHLFQAVLSDEVLLVSQLRADSFYSAFLAKKQNLDAPDYQINHAHSADGVFVGCAGLQDRPDLHLTLFRLLERESGHTELLKLLQTLHRPSDSWYFPANHEGLDEIACVSINILERLVLYRTDAYLECQDRNLERAVLQLTGPMVQCMGRFALPLGLPSSHQSMSDLNSALATAASRLVSLVCRLDLRSAQAMDLGPSTIRQSWEWHEHELQRQILADEEWRQRETRAVANGKQRPTHAQNEKVGGSSKRQLLDLATCHGQDVDTRVAVLALLTEALASQPGLADWLFDQDEDSNVTVANALSSEAGCAAGASRKSITLDRQAISKDGYYDGWVVEIRGGKGLGQAAQVVGWYDGSTKTAWLSSPWDSSHELPDTSSQYLISKQLQLRRIVKTLLHPDVPFSGGPGPSSERLLNRLKILEYSLMLVETIWLHTPFERASIVQGFSDGDCLVWGMASPDQGKIVNKTNRWREYTMRLHVASGSRSAMRIIAAPRQAYAEMTSGATAAAEVNGSKAAGRVVTKGPQKDSNVLGWLLPSLDTPSDPPKPAAQELQSTSTSDGQSSFWDMMQGYALPTHMRMSSTTPASDSLSQLSIEWQWGLDEGGGQGVAAQESMAWEADTPTRHLVVRVQLPSTMRRCILPLLDVGSDQCKLFVFLKDRERVKRAADAMAHCSLYGRTARQMYSEMRQLATARNASQVEDRIKAELEILDASLQFFEAEGIDLTQRLDMALDDMWHRLRFHLVSSGIGGDAAGGIGKKPLAPLRLPIVMRKWLYDSLHDGSKAECLDDLFKRTATYLNLPVPFTEAIECQCRRMHIQALAVSVCALDLEEGDGAKHAAAAERSASERPKFARRLIEHALLELSTLPAYWDQQGEGLSTDVRLAGDRGEGTGDLHTTLLDESGESLEEAVHKLDGLQRVLMALAEGKGNAELGYRCRVEYKLKSLHDFSADWLYDTRRISMLNPWLAAVGSGLNVDRAFVDLDSLQILAYCRLMQAAAEHHPGVLVAVLRDSSHSDGQALNLLLTGIAERLDMRHVKARLQQGHGDLELHFQLARTLSTLIHCAWLQCGGQGAVAVRLLSSLVQTLEVASDLSKDVAGVSATSEPSDAKHRLDSESLYEALLDSVMRLLLHVQDMHAQHSGASHGTRSSTGMPGSLWGAGNLVVRLSSVAGHHLKRSGAGGRAARKSCALLTILGRISAWGDAVHWESLLDQNFWKEAPGLLVWMTGSHLAVAAGLDDKSEASSDSLSTKEAAADALAALDLVLDVAQHERGAVTLAASSTLLFLRQGTLAAKVLAVDGQPLQLYVGAGNAPSRNPWHTVWCRGLQAVQVLSMRLDRAEGLHESSLEETLAFVVTFYDRLQHVLLRTCASWASSAAGAGRTPGCSDITYMTGLSQGWQAGAKAGAGGAGGDVGLGGELSLALLEEAKLWTAILLRLARKLPLWKSQAPALSQAMIQQVPVVVATLVEALALWKGEGKDDWVRFKSRFRPVSQDEQLLARMLPSAGVSREEPGKDALTPMDAELLQAFDVMQKLLPPDGGAGGIHHATLKFWHQRCAFDQLVLDTLSATLHNCLRILTCCGDAGLTHVDLSTKPIATSGTYPEVGNSASRSLPVSSLSSFSYGHAGASVLGDGEISGTMTGRGAYTMTPGLRAVRCNVLTLTKAIECAGSFLQFLLQVEACADKRLQSSFSSDTMEHSEWLQEHSALVHRRKMLLRIAECSAILLGRLAGRHMDSGETPRAHNLQELFDLHKLRKDLLPLSNPLPAPVQAEISRSIAFMRSATRSISETI